MLRRSSQQSYVCWRCLGLGQAERALLTRQRAPHPQASTGAASGGGAPAAAATRRAAVVAHGRRSYHSVATNAASPAASDWAFDWGQERKIHVSTEESPVRQRLRRWELENPAAAFSHLKDEPVDGAHANTFTKNRSDFTFRIEDPTQGDDDTSRPQFDGDGVVDLGVTGSLLQSGDLVEVSSGASRLRMLAVCLGTFNGHLHFYTNTGKWFTTRAIRSGFVVKNFVRDPAELRAVVEAIPSLSPDSTVLNELQDLNVGPSRDLAASLIRRMHTFQSASRLVHQTYVERLSRADTQLGSEERLLSLRDIASALLPASLKRARGAFPAEALYAVYSVVEQDDVAFRALDLGARHHESYLFMLHSAETQQNVRRVEQLVRDYYEARLQKPSYAAMDAVATAGFLEFVGMARELIDQSRRERDWSPHGVLGPRKKGRSEPCEVSAPQWSETSLAVIRFMHHWAASQGFRTGSRSHWIGAAVLRALERYDEAILDESTGWTLLQELGWIPPWDVSARHELRLPGIQLSRHAGLLPPPPAGASALAPDRLADLRQDFARSTVYCIDSADTMDVDDGFSLESLGNGEHWIHVHVADPASRILPNDPLAKQAALRMQTSYLSGFYRRMLDGDDIRDAFSLGPNRPTLTFSARVSDTGRVLESKITPGILRDVVYMTPEDADSVCGEDTRMSSPPSLVLEVGTPPGAKQAPSNRAMTTPRDLSRKQHNDLKTLFSLANALHRVRLENGAIPHYLPRPRANVSLDGVAAAVSGEGSTFYNGDPRIRVSYEGTEGNHMVSSLMQLAGEIGARWCYERDIPVPYRVQLIAGDNLEALRAFNRDVFYPKLKAGQVPPPEDWHTLRTLAGGFDVSTTPAPNLAMGLELYTKVTSPLRRYPDLLVHWQIEAALLEEHKRGTSLAVRQVPESSLAPTGDATPTPTPTPATATPTPSPPKAAKPATTTTTSSSEPRAWLPFTKDHVEDRILPHLRIRERHARLVDNLDGNNQWILQALVRAWRFGEASVPDTFRFTVDDVVGRRAVRGLIDWFDRRATAEVQDLNGVVRIAEVKTGDVFRVELAGVDVRRRGVRVRLLERVEEAVEGKVEEKIEG